MGWGRYFLLGDFGQQMDLQDRQQEMEQLRDQLQGQYDRDRAQDDWILALRKENQELKMYMTALVRLLISKNVVSEGEVKGIVEGVEGTG